LIFALYKKEASRLEETLKRKGWKCGSIHGDKGQADRTKVCFFMTFDVIFSTFLGFAVIFSTFLGEKRDGNF